MFQLFVVLLMLTSGAWPAGAAPSPWRDLAVAEVDRLHQSVVDFRPGTRDTDTPDFASRVETANRTAKVRAEGATFYADWLAATPGFMLSFRDGHIIFRQPRERLRGVPKLRWAGAMDDDSEIEGWIATMAADPTP